MKKIIVVAQIALICSIAISGIKDFMDALALLVLAISALLNLSEVIRDGKKSKTTGKVE